MSPTEAFFFSRFACSRFPGLRPGNPIQKPMPLTQGKYSINIYKQPVSFRHGQSSWSRGHCYFFFYFKWGCIVHIVRYVIYVCVVFGHLGGVGAQKCCLPRWMTDLPRSFVTRTPYTPYVGYIALRGWLHDLCVFAQLASVSGAVHLSSSNSPDCY